MKCTVDAGFEAITGDELLKSLWGGALALEAGQVYVLAVVVPETLDDPIWSTATVLSLPEPQDTPTETLAEALRLMGEHSQDLVINAKRAQEIREARA